MNSSVQGVAGILRGLLPGRRLLVVVLLLAIGCLSVEALAHDHSESDGSHHCLFCHWSHSGALLDSRTPDARPHLVIRSITSFDQLAPEGPNLIDHPARAPPAPVPSSTD